MSPTRRALLHGLGAGTGITSALIGLHADWRGQEGYAKYIMEHWVTPKISVPLEVLAIIVGVTTMVLVWRRSARQRVAAMSVVEPKHGDRTLALILEYGPRQAARLDLPMRGAAEISMALGHGVRLALGEEPKPEPESERTRPSAWEKIDLKAFDEDTK